MDLISSTESHPFSLVASGLSKSGFPVFFSYSLRARFKPASRIDLKFEGGFWLRVGDMVLSRLEMIAEDSVCESRAGNTRYDMVPVAREGAWEAASQCLVGVSEGLHG